MNLLRAELARIIYRRITRSAVVIAALGVGAVGILTFVGHSAAAPDMARAESIAAQNSADCLASYELDSYGMSDAEVAQACTFEAAWFVSDENFHLQSMLAGNGSQPFDQTRAESMVRYDFPEIGANAQSPANGLKNTLAGSGVLLALAAAVLGASFVGADWRSGVIESQLVRQPNRARLFGAKLGAIAITAGTAAVLTSSALMLVVLPSARWRGDAANTGMDFWLATAGMIGRIGIAAALFAIAAAGIAMIARNTAAGVTVGLVAFIIGGIVAGISGSWTRFVAIPQNLTAWISNGDVGYQFTRNSGGGTEYYELMGHSWLVAGVLMAAVAGVITIVGAGTFARRDVS